MLEELGADLQTQARLAAAARSRQRHESLRVAQHGRQLRELVLPADERIRRDRKIRRVEALQRWEVAVAELVDALRRNQVLQPVPAEAPEAGTADKVTRRPRDENLSAVARRSDTRRAGHV